MCQVLILDPDRSNWSPIFKRYEPHNSRQDTFHWSLIYEIFEKFTENYNWVYTPEQRDYISNQIPDYTVKTIYPSLSKTDLNP